MKTGSMSEMMLTLTGPHDGKFGSTTTIKEQVENIEVLIQKHRLLYNTFARHSKYSASARMTYRCKSKHSKRRRGQI